MGSGQGRVGSRSEAWPQWGGQTLDFEPWWRLSLELVTFVYPPCYNEMGGGGLRPGAWNTWEGGGSPLAQRQARGTPQLCRDAGYAYWPGRNTATGRTPAPPLGHPAVSDLGTGPPLQLFPSLSFPGAILSPGGASGDPGAGTLPACAWAAPPARANTASPASCGDSGRAPREVIVGEPVPICGVGPLPPDRRFRYLGGSCCVQAPAGSTHFYVPVAPR